MNKLYGILIRLVATFVAAALAIVSGAAMVAPELALWQSAVLAGCVSTFDAVRKLASSLRDGDLTDDEVDAAFGTPREKAIKAARKVRSKAVTKAVDTYVVAEKKADAAAVIAVLDAPPVPDDGSE